jgi:hypothetical protein
MESEQSQLICQPKKRFSITIDQGIDEDISEFDLPKKLVGNFEVLTVNYKPKAGTNSSYPSLLSRDGISQDISNFINSNQLEPQKEKHITLKTLGELHQEKNSYTKTLPDRRPIDKKTKMQMCSPICRVI